MANDFLLGHIIVYNVVFISFYRLSTDGGKGSKGKNQDQ